MLERVSAHIIAHYYVAKKSSSIKMVVGPCDFSVSLSPLDLGFGIRDQA